MTHLPSQKIFTAFDDALEVSSRWPRVLLALGFDARSEHPGPRALNAALVARGFKPVIDENDALLSLLKDYPDAWWFAVAREVAGAPDATVQDVVGRLGTPPGGSDGTIG